MKLSSAATAVEDVSSREWDARNPEESEEATEQRRKRELIRERCRDQLEACVADRRSAMTQRDVEGYMKSLQEENLDQWETEDEKTHEVQRMAGEWAQDFIRRAKDVGELALRLIDEAADKRWILRSKAEEWRRKLKDESTSGMQKTNFIEKVLPKWQKNWEQIAKDSGTVKRLEKELNLTAEERQKYPALAAFHSPAFWSGEMPFSERRKIVTEAKKILEALRKKQVEMQKNPVNRDIAAAQKQVQEKMKTVDAVPVIRTTIRTRVEKLIGGKERQGNTAEMHLAFLQDLLRSWPRIQKFARLEERRKKEGSPRSFNFVHFSVFFFEWDGTRQDTYLTEGLNRFTDLEKERCNFLLIRHALDTEDWEEAETLIAREKQALETMTPEDAEKLRSMEEYLQAHRPKQVQPERKESPTDEEVLQETRNLLNLIPASQRRLHAQCLRYGFGTFRAQCSLWYNRVWLHRKRGANAQAETQWMAEAQEYTPERIEHGHGRGLEANDLRGTNNQRAAIRNQEKVIAPQIVRGGQESADVLANECNRLKDSWRFWYWTTYIPEEVTFARHEQIVDEVHPQLKRLSRELDRRGILFTQEGGVQYKNKAPTAAKPAPRQKETSHAMAA